MIINHVFLYSKTVNEIQIADVIFKIQRNIAKQKQEHMKKANIFQKVGQKHVNIPNIQNLFERKEHTKQQPFYYFKLTFPFPKSATYHVPSLVNSFNNRGANNSKQKQLFFTFFKLQKW